jgi:hypothetical protein
MAAAAVQRPGCWMWKHDGDRFDEIRWAELMVRGDWIELGRAAGSADQAGAILVPNIRDGDAMFVAF